MITKYAFFFQGDDEDSDQTARTVIWVFVGRTCHKVRFIFSLYIMFHFVFVFVMLCHILCPFTGATVDLGIVDQRTIRFANLTIQDGGILELHSDYDNINDYWELRVSFVHSTDTGPTLQFCSYKKMNIRLRSTMSSVK